MIRPKGIVSLAGVCLACCLGTFANAADATSEISSAAPKGIAKSLFDGKSLDGWTQLPADSWEVKDGALASKGTARGELLTNKDYKNYRLMFTMRHVSGGDGGKNKDHQACVLVFCTRPGEGQKPLNGLAGIQFQVPLGGGWDYREGHNDGGKGLYTRKLKPTFNPHEWSRVELLINADKGEGKMAVAQPVGSKAIEVVEFKEPEAGKVGPIALQIHNAALFDEYKDIEIEVDPPSDELITVK